MDFKRYGTIFHSFLNFHLSTHISNDLNLTFYTKIYHNQKISQYFITILN
jgi:hypothetical protein